MKEKIVRSGEGKQLNILGDNQTIKLTARDTNGQFTLITQNNPPNTQVPKHVHTHEDEVFTVIEGTVEVEIDDRKVILENGDMIFLPKTIPHSFKVVGTTNARVIINMFPAGMEDMFEELSQLPAGPPDLSKVTTICGKYGLRFV